MCLVQKYKYKVHVYDGYQKITKVCFINLLTTRNKMEGNQEINDLMIFNIFSQMNISCFCKSEVTGWFSKELQSPVEDFPQSSV